MLQSLQALTPRVERFQRQRAAARFNQREVLADPDLLDDRELSKWVKDALSHYWGGPKLTDNPLRGLRVVRVLPNTVAQKAGVQAGDLLLAVDGRTLTSPKDIHDAIRTAPFALHRYRLQRGERDEIREGLRRPRRADLRRTSDDRRWGVHSRATRKGSR